MGLFAFGMARRTIETLRLRPTPPALAPGAPLRIYRSIGVAPAAAYMGLAYHVINVDDLLVGRLYRVMFNDVMRWVADVPPQANRSTWRIVAVDQSTRDDALAQLRVYLQASNRGD